MIVTGRQGNISVLGHVNFPSSYVADRNSFVMTYLMNKPNQTTKEENDV